MIKDTLIVSAWYSTLWKSCLRKTFHPLTHKVENLVQTSKQKLVGFSYKLLSRGTFQSRQCR